MGDSLDWGACRKAPNSWGSTKRRVSPGHSSYAETMRQEPAWPGCRL